MSCRLQREIGERGYCDVTFNAIFMVQMIPSILETNLREEGCSFCEEDLTHGTVGGDFR
jgi:hypothetical protein